MSMWRRVWYKISGTWCVRRKRLWSCRQINLWKLFFIIVYLSMRRLLLLIKSIWGKRNYRIFINGSCIHCKNNVCRGIFLKDYIAKRAVEIANYIIENNATVRQTAKQFGISKSTVHMVVIKWNGLWKRYMWWSE